MPHRVDAPLQEVFLLLYIGIDVHKKWCYATLKDRDGRELDQFRFLNRTEGFHRLLKVVADRPAKAVVESTGNLWLRLYLVLERGGIEVLLSNPSMTKAIAHARLKSDKVDSSTLADLLRADLIARCYVPPAEVRAARAMIRMHMNLVKDRTRVKNRIHSVLHKYEVPGFKGSDQFGKSGIAWLKRLKLSEGDQLILDTLIRQLECLNQLIDETHRRVARAAVNRKDIRLLMTIPGIGFYSAMLIVSEIGDVTRFATSSKLVSWLGLAPSVHQSGNTCHHGKITKKGSPRVRWILVEAAQTSVRHDDHFRSKYIRIARRRGKRKAIVAVAREMVVACYHMLTRGEEYRYKSEELVKRKYKKLESKARGVPCVEGRAETLCRE